VNTNSDRRQFYEKFKNDKEYRDLFIAEHIYTRLPLKIRRIREQLGWSQKELGEKVGMAQAWVSRLEDPSYGKYTIATLLRLASAFDVGLDIDFKLFSKILDKALTLTPESFEVVSFADDPGFVEYRTGTAERPQGKPVTSVSHQGKPDEGEGRARDSSTRYAPTPHDTHSLVTSVFIAESKVTEPPKELTAYAAEATAV
jgi:transcriptional regulator with XRE-family HTH domain